MKQTFNKHLCYKFWNSMKNIKGILVTIILATVVMTGCKNNTVKQTTVSNKKDSVAVFILQREAFNKEITFPGELLPMERAEIFAKISGYVKSLKVDIGDKVQKGQVIAVLDAPEMIANYAQINSDVQTARSKYVGSLDAYKRITNAAKVEGTIATGELERIKSQMMVDSSSLQAAKSKLNAYAQLKDYLVIRSPFSGVVTQRNIDPGTLVGTGNTKPILVIENNNSLRLRLPVPEAYTSANPDSSSVHFTVDAYPGVKFEAKLSRKAGALNLTNRTEAWEFQYANKDNQLKSGMFANASIKFRRSAPSFLVPLTAVVTNNEKRFVIRLKDSKAEWIDVRNGISVDNKMEIFGNLLAGDTLLIKGTDEIKEGMKVTAKLTPGTAR
jgi:membrane fusion protein (multidrug efflux system)